MTVCLASERRAIALALGGSILSGELVFDLLLGEGGSIVFVFFQLIVKFFYQGISCILFLLKIFNCIHRLIELLVLKDFLLLHSGTVLLKDIQIVLSLIQCISSLRKQKFQLVNSLSVLVCQF